LIPSYSVKAGCKKSIYLKLDMLDDDPLLQRALPFTDGCFIGTAALWSLATPLSGTAAYLETLSSPFTCAMACNGFTSDNSKVTM
jgi:hypothetical protein